MSDERDIYCDNNSIGDLSYFWHSAVQILFSDNDFYSRPISKAHAVVRKNISEFHEGNLAQYLYAPAIKVRARLQQQGYSHAKCAALWEREHTRHIAFLETLLENADDEFAAEVEAQKGLNFQTWVAREEEMEVNELLKWGGMHLLNFSDTFAELALFIDVRKPKAIWTDLSPFYSDEFDPALPLHANLSREPGDMGIELVERTGNVLILTEGPSDTRILSAAIRAMYPEFSDMFSFVDFEEFKVEGGASPLTKMVRAFAGVRMSQRILALFDNDAAGHEQHEVLAKSRLPENIRSMKLPHSSIAAKYPTIGPEGFRTMDINGTACSIELFLGRPALQDDSGKLQPVRWSSWNKRAQRYQGELENKNAVTERFMKAMNSGQSPGRLRAQFKDMDTLLKAIFNAFEA